MGIVARSQPAWRPLVNRQAAGANLCYGRSVDEQSPLSFLLESIVKTVLESTIKSLDPTGQRQSSLGQPLSFIK